jgi:hypothetical protein
MKAKGLSSVMVATMRILAFASILLFAIVCLGSAEGETKNAPGAPDS